MAPLAALSAPKMPRRLPRPVEANAALRLANSDDRTLYDGPPWMAARDAAFFTLLYGAGLRLSEALALNWQDVRGQTLRVLGKGGKGRDVPILPAVRSVLDDYEAKLDAASGTAALATRLELGDQAPVFLGARGARLAASVAQRQMQRLRPKLGLDDSATTACPAPRFCNTSA